MKKTNETKAASRNRPHVEWGWVFPRTPRWNGVRVTSHGPYVEAGRARAANRRVRLSSSESQWGGGSRGYSGTLLPPKKVHVLFGAASALYRLHNNTKHVQSQREMMTHAEQTDMSQMPEFIWLHLETDRTDSSGFHLIPVTVNGHIGSGLNNYLKIVLRCQ